MPVNTLRFYYDTNLIWGKDTIWIQNGDIMGCSNKAETFSTTLKRIKAGYGGSYIKYFDDQLGRLVEFDGYSPLFQLIVDDL